MNFGHTLHRILAQCRGKSFDYVSEDWENHFNGLICEGKDFGAKGKDS
jgi:hypothetical protein